MPFICLSSFLKKFINNIKFIGHVKMQYTYHSVTYVMANDKSNTEKLTTTTTTTTTKMIARDWEMCYTTLISRV